MKYLKLLLISVIGFVAIFWGITLLFPSLTIISRAANVVRQDSIPLAAQMRSNQLSYRRWLLPESANAWDLRTADIPFYSAALFNADSNSLTKGDTIYLKLQKPGDPPVFGGIAFYNLRDDSTTVQLFYVFENPWYKPWEKMRMMVMDKAIGPGMDSALQRLRLAVQP